MAFVYAWIVPSWADQLLPQLLMEQFDTLFAAITQGLHMVNVLNTLKLQAPKFMAKNNF